MKNWEKWEISLGLAVAATIVWCAVSPVNLWWTSAFSPLCDGILTGEAGGEGIVLRSYLWELLSRLVH